MESNPQKTKFVLPSLAVTQEGLFEGPYSGELGMAAMNHLHGFVDSISSLTGKYSSLSGYVAFLHSFSEGLELALQARHLQAQTFLHALYQVDLPDIEKTLRIIESRGVIDFGSAHPETRFPVAVTEYARAENEAFKYETRLLFEIGISWLGANIARKDPGLSDILRVHLVNSGNANKVINTILNREQNVLRNWGKMREIAARSSRDFPQKEPFAQILAFIPPTDGALDQLDETITAFYEKKFTELYN